MRIRRIGAYGLCHDSAGRVLLARNSELSEFPGRWGLPGGGVQQGEHPDDAVRREFAEETGLTVRVTGLHSVTADVARLPGSSALEHTDRIIYHVEMVGGGLRAEVDGTTDTVDWVVPDDRLMMPFTARILGLPVDRIDADSRPDRLVVDHVSGTPRSVQRFGAYALATDPTGRILLTRIAPGYPGAGRWHLPGGGTDHGETPEQGLARELAEETSQQGRITELIGVSNRHDPAALGPEGIPIDWHVVRVLFRVSVDAPTEPRVTEEAGGSTEAAGWFGPAQLFDLPLTDVARLAVEGLAGEMVS